MPLSTVWTVLLMGCAADRALPDDVVVDRAVPWIKARGPLDEDIGAIGPWRPARAIVHLHSPWSHDACDGEGLVDGVPNPTCLQDLRDGLCAAGVDVAFGTDHPSYAADQEYDDLLYCHEDGCAVGAAGEGDRVAWVDDEARGLLVACDTARSPLWLPGFEGGLMPVGLHHHAAEDEAGRDAAYRSETAEAIAPLQAAGATVLQAHTEQRALSYLESLVASGLTGVEIFNLHAMFDPDIRSEYLGLEGLGWISDLGPFINPESTAEPDLAFLAVLMEQAPSLATFDALQALGPVVGVAGTDAHENVLPSLMRDGERADSYRRMLSWFFNVLLVDPAAERLDGYTAGPDAYAEALAAGRLYVAFEVLGVPDGFDFYLEDEGGGRWDMGAVAPEGTLHVGCPKLSPASPRGQEDPEISVSILRNGYPWQAGCGDFPADGPAVYRVSATLIPNHLRDFLGDDPEPWLHSYPWILSNPIHVDPGA